MSVLQQISIYSSLLPLITFFLFCLKRRKKELTVIFAYVLFSFAIDFITTYVGKDNLYTIQAIFTIAEYLFVSTFIYFSLSNYYFKKVIFFTSIVFILFAVFSFIRTDKTKFDSIPSSLEAILIITYCILYMFEQINKPEISFIYASSNFWVVLGFFIYMSGTLFLFITSNTISSSEKLQFWVINQILNSILNIFISLAFFINRKKPKSEIPLSDYYKDY
jgi:hypothetical protein